MAACSHAITLASSSNLSAYTTTGFTPVVGDLLVVFVAKTASIIPGTCTDSQSGTYVQAHIVNKASGSDELQVFVRTALVPAASSTTVTYDCTGDAATGCFIFVVRVSGMTRTGALAVRQFAGQSAQAGGTTPSAVFPAACLTGNPTLGCVFNATSPAGMTPPTSWTELVVDVGFSQPTSGCEYVIRNSGFTGTTITWGSTSASAYCDLTIELDTSAPASRRIFLVT